jgi:hypothetical protein
MGQITNYYFKKSIEQFAKEIVKELKSQLKSEGKKATGELIQSIDYKLVEASGGIELDILAASYLKWVDAGRKKGAKQIPGPALVKWAKIRGFKPNPKKGYKTIEEVGWAISRKIQTTGIKATNVLDNTKKAIFSNKVIMDKLANGGLLDLQKLINDSFAEIGAKKTTSISPGSYGSSFSV